MAVPRSDTGSPPPPGLSFERVSALAQGRWHEILVQLGIPPEALQNRHGPCPGCGGRDRYRYDDRDGRGTWICSGGGEMVAGDGYALLRHVHGWSAAEALRQVAAVVGGEAGSLPAATPRRRQQTASRAGRQVADLAMRRRRLADMWREAVQVTSGDPVALYLAGRGLDLSTYSATLRYHPQLPYRSEDGTYTRHPAMLALVQDVRGRRVCLHRTYLTAAGAKADLPTPRRLMPPAWPGATRGAAVRLAPPAETLAVAEGLETALAFGALVQLPAWATISAGGMAALEIPEGVREVLIGADHDAAGQQAAQALAARLRRQWVAAYIRTPQRPGSDWADMLTSPKKTRR